MGRKRRHKKGRCTKRNRQTQDSEAPEPKELVNAPHSFVMHRGNVGIYIRELVTDFRKVMEPFTASNLKVMKKNTLKDFLSVAGLLHVTHFCIFTRTDSGAYFRVGRVPRGPSLSFRICNYTLARDVISSMKKQFVFHKQFEHPPLVVLNGFAGEGMHMKVMATTFQNMFPTINLLKVDLSNVRRCVLFNYDPATKLIDFRHFAIKVVPAGVSKSVKKIVQNKVPNLNRYKDVAEYLTKPTQLSESEGEDDPNSHVVLPQTLSSRGNLASNVSAIRVVEIGPRMTFELLKLESGFFTGDVLYHSYIKKSKEEIEEMKKILEKKKMLKERRKAEQRENVRKKELKKEQLKDKSLKGMKVRFGKVKKDDEEEEELPDDDDAEWYKAEVGEEPEPELFTSSSGAVKRKKPMPSPFVRRKKAKQAKEAKGNHSKDFGAEKRFLGKKNKGYGNKKFPSARKREKNKPKKH